METLTVQHCPLPECHEGNAVDKQKVIAFILSKETNEHLCYKPTTSKEKVLKDKNPIFAEDVYTAAAKLKKIYKTPHPALLTVEVHDRYYGQKDYITVYKKPRIAHDVSPEMLASFLKQFGPHRNISDTNGWSRITCVRTGTALYPDNNDIRKWGIYIRRRTKTRKHRMLVYNPKVARRQLKKIEQHREKLAVKDPKQEVFHQTTVTLGNISLIGVHLTRTIMVMSKDQWNYKYDIKQGGYTKHEHCRYLMFMIDLFEKIFGKHSYRRSSHFQKFKKIWKTHIKVIRRDNKVPERFKAFMENEVTKRSPAKATIDVFKIKKGSIFYHAHNETNKHKSIA